MFSQDQAPDKISKITSMKWTIYMELIFYKNKAELEICFWKTDKPYLWIWLWILSGYVLSASLYCSIYNE